MPIPTWILEHLDGQGVRYRARSHPSAYTAADVAKLEHTSGVRLGKVVVVLADEMPVLFVMPAYAHVDEARARYLLRARDLRIAREQEIERLLPGAAAGATPPLRHWRDVELYMDPLLQHEGPFLFQAGTHEDAIELDFADWVRVARPKVGVFVTPTFIGA